MSELQKRIGKVQKREPVGGFGFGSARRELSRAMVLAVAVSDAAGAKTALTAGADCVVVSGLDAKAAAAVIKGLDKGRAGAHVPSLDEAGAAALAEAGCDFVISALATTGALAVDTEKLGHILEATPDVTDTTLRALAPLGLDGLYVPGGAESMTMASRLELVRLSSFASSALVMPVAKDAAANALRVLRDSGVGAVVAPLGTAASELEALSDALKAVPAQKSSRRGGDIAMVPAMRGQSDAGEDDPDDDDDE